MSQSKLHREDVWLKSPITGLNQVLCEYDDKNGESKVDMSSGFYTNEYPLNHKKNPDFNIEEYEAKMPNIIKDLRFDDGESYWYPATIQTEEAIVFPVGNQEEWKWCYANIKMLTSKELEESSKVISFESKIDMENAQYFERYLDAVKKIKGYSLGDFTS